MVFSGEIPENRIFLVGHRLFSSMTISEFDETLHLLFEVITLSTVLESVIPKTAAAS
jgi:hypothetical protein